MATYPIIVPRDHYHGKDQRRRRKAHRHNEIAKRCEDYLNQKIRDNPAGIQQYVYGYIASGLSLTTGEVCKVMFAVDCGHSGITVRKTAASITP